MKLIEQTIKTDRYNKGEDKDEKIDALELN
jgi:hypothetical protein